jgi:hypothetical protein
MGITISLTRRIHIHIIMMFNVMIIINFIHIIIINLIHIKIRIIAMIIIISYNPQEFLLFK